MKSKNWWKAAGIRALKTVAQTALAALSTAYVLADVDWLVVGSAFCPGGHLVPADQFGRAARS